MSTLELQNDASEAVETSPEDEFIRAAQLLLIERFQAAKKDPDEDRIPSDSILQITHTKLHLDDSWQDPHIEIGVDFEFESSDRKFHGFPVADFFVVNGESSPFNTREWQRDTVFGPKVAAEVMGKTVCIPIHVLDVPGASKHVLKRERSTVRDRLNTGVRGEGVSLSILDEFDFDLSRS